MNSFDELLPTKLATQLASYHPEPTLISLQQRTAKDAHHIMANMHVFSRDRSRRSSGVMTYASEPYIYHSQWSESNLCSYCNDFLLSGKIRSRSRECECIPCTVHCPNCLCCFPQLFAVMVFIALWDNQDDTYTNSTHVVGAYRKCSKKLII